MALCHFGLRASSTAESSTSSVRQGNGVFCACLRGFPTQRYGRVVRISTGFQRVEASDLFVPVLETEVDRRMFTTLVHRCLMIQRLLPSRHGLIPHPDHLPKSRLGVQFPENQMSR